MHETEVAEEMGSEETSGLEMTTEVDVGGGVELEVGAEGGDQVRLETGMEKVRGRRDGLGARRPAVPGTSERRVEGEMEGAQGVRRIGE